MQRSERYNPNRYDDPRRDPRPEDHSTVINALLLVAICTFLASLFPRDLFAMLLSSFLFVAACGSVAAAVLQGQHIFADRFTDWDIAAFALSSSIILSWFIDPGAVAAAVAAEGTTAVQGEIEGHSR